MKFRNDLLQEDDNCVMVCIRFLDGSINYIPLVYTNKSSKFGENDKEEVFQWFKSKTKALGVWRFKSFERKYK